MAAGAMAAGSGGRRIKAWGKLAAMEVEAKGRGRQKEKLGLIRNSFGNKLF